MENKQVLKLIDGTFLPSEAGKVLFELINRKINYHQMERFSNEERFGKDESNSRGRIEQLKDARRRLEEIIDYTSIKGLRLKIESSIDITFIKEN
jgi:hypothetical protein